MQAGLECVNAPRTVEQTLAPEPRLTRAAHEFEAQMMKELLTPMTGKDPLFGDDDAENAGVLGQFAAESLAGALSSGGGLGLADRIVHALSGSRHNTEDSQGIGKSKTIPE